MWFMQFCTKAHWAPPEMRSFDMVTHRHLKETAKVMCLGLVKSVCKRYPEERLFFLPIQPLSW
jgi:hypothetical protein